MEARESSIVTRSTEKIEPNQTMASTWIVVVVLFIALVVLKKFIFIKDDKRDGL